MPELPEVELVKLQLTKYLAGHRIISVDINYPKMFSGDKKNLLSKVKGVRRFGKVVSIDLANNYSVLIHIKLTGQLIYRGPNLKNPQKLSNKVTGGIPGPHSHVVFHLDRGGSLFFNDVRKFGWLRTMKTSSVAKEGFVANLGPEPLSDLSLKEFQTILGKTHRMIKVLLMDQTKIGGIGNIYANDALWLAKIHPERKANELSEKETKRLYRAINKVLREGLKTGGASELAFVRPDGTEGNYQKHFLAYGKKDILCSRCKKRKFAKIKVGGRGTYFCPVCQGRSVATPLGI